jgi:hypothetical protein
MNTNVISDSERGKPPVSTRNCLLCDVPIPPGFPCIYIPGTPPRIGHISPYDCRKRKDAARSSNPHPPARHT